MQETDSLAAFSREHTHTSRSKGKGHRREADAGLLRIPAGLLLPAMTQDLPWTKAAPSDPSKIDRCG